MENNRKEFSLLSKKIREFLPEFCSNCGIQQELDIHHIVPLSIGGTNRISNFCYLCKNCHMKIHNQKSKDFKSLQRIGIERAKKEGKHLGRPKMNLDTLSEKQKEILNKDYYKWKNKEITAKFFMEKLELKRNTFYKIIKQYEKQNELSESQ